MNLLLLLSALLSALTGVGGTMRGADPAPMVAAGTLVTPVVGERKIAANLRPDAPMPVLAEMAPFGVIAAPAIFAHEPLYASRRRE